MSKFEIVSAYKDKNINLPVRKTKGSAGYDFEVAEDIVIPAAEDLSTKMIHEIMDITNGYVNPLNLDEMAAFTKKLNAKPTLVPTGIKCKLDEGTYLELSVRSSCPLKYWLILANGVGIIDSDYYDNESNEGHIYFQIINLSPIPIQLHAGDVIGQGIIKTYLLTEDDSASGIREGGFGSTS